MKQLPKKDKIFAVIYLSCTVICAVRAVLAMVTGNMTVGITRLMLAVIFLVAFIRYFNR